MPERFNIPIVLSRALSPEERAEFAFAVRDTYLPLFRAFKEASVFSYETEEWENLPWPEGEALLQDLEPEHELLFLYGEWLGETADARSCVGIEESEAGSRLTLSFPLPTDTPAAQLEAHVLSARDLAARYASAFVVAGGWELECESEDGISDFVRECFSKNTLCSWLAAPALLLPKLPSHFVKVSEAERVVLVRRE
ncbi:hypothetical protein [Burkholderia sp. Ac-20379]|uniref:hypothetical protein n=1 Tax=Burkholderia sp. Ac-20379 TaxID=2703900 RepID=UPI001981A15D|nr:hypothetical protein [Burkholderia sp. Ac-20379]MBN3725181.1 hypothetical protein [Burkholderia sp. Ac-20379]